MSCGLAIATMLLLTNPEVALAAAQPPAAADAPVSVAGEPLFADIVARYGEGSGIPTALTDYIKNREGYDYAQHGKSGNTHTEFVPDEIIDRFCVLGTEEQHIERLQALEALGVDQFAIYLMHDQKDETLNAYGQRIIPALRGQ